MTTKEKPIIFSAENVKQILSGAKTQTRRVVKPQPDDWTPYTQPEWYTSSAIDKDGMLVPGKEVFGVYSEDGECSRVCPFGAPGDRLWVKEAFWQHEFWDETFVAFSDSGTDVVSRNNKTSKIRAVATQDWNLPPYRGQWIKKSPLFMPRWASRLTLEITNVRCERLQDISDADVIAEGFGDVGRFYRNSTFIVTWDSLNAKRGFDWCMNPYVWVLESKKVESEVLHG